MLIHNTVNTYFCSCTYVLTVDDFSWLVDCGDVEPILSLIKGKNLIGVLLTHAHFDHIYGLNELLKLFPNTLVYTNECGTETLLDARKNMSLYHETPFVLERPDNIRIVNDGDEIELSYGLKAIVKATPGHHPSCLTYIIGDAIFTGDSYIPGTKVVTILPKGNKAQAQQSVEIILALRQGKIIYPGHKI
jgi:glyoxylase-like metal-dependent hydrolase (beta-lactamase superfamily II)